VPCQRIVLQWASLGASPDGWCPGSHVREPCITKHSEA
jgi:hypothetical protein